MRSGIEAQHLHRLKWPQNCRGNTGSFLSKTTALVLGLSTRSKYLISSRAFIVSPITQAPGWDLQFANGSSSASAGESGSNPSLAGGRRFSLQSQPAEGRPRQTSKSRAVSVVLV